MPMTVERAALHSALQAMIRAVLRGDAWTRDVLWRDRERLNDIARAAQAGDGDARNALCVVLHPYLERIALQIGVVRRDVPDIVQETLFAAHLNLDRFDPGLGSVRTWVTTILARLRLNLLRRRARRVRALEAMAGASSGAASLFTSAPYDMAQISHDVAGMLAGLSRRQRQVLTIYAIGGLSARDTGRALGLTAAGVRSIARDARRHMAQLRDH